MLMSHTEANMKKGFEKRGEDRQFEKGKVTN